MSLQTVLRQKNGWFSFLLKPATWQWYRRSSSSFHRRPRHGFKSFFCEDKRRKCKKL